MELYEFQILRACALAPTPLKGFVLDVLRAYGVCGVCGVCGVWRCVAVWCGVVCTACVGPAGGGLCDVLMCNFINAYECYSFRVRFCHKSVASSCIVCT